MRIAVDLHGIQSNGSRTRGIGRYSSEIIKNIILSFPEHQIILIANAALSDLKHEFNIFLNYKNVSYVKWYAPCPFDFVSGNKIKRKIAKYLKSYTYGCINADIILITSFFEGYSDNCLVDFDRDFINIPILSICYDLIPLINHDLYLKNNPDFKKFYYSRLRDLNKLDGVLAISYSSAQEAIKYLTINSSQVFNISSACDRSIFNKESDISSYLTLKIINFTPFILYSGAIDPRKNVKNLFEAFSKLPPELDDYKLVLVGKLLLIEEEIVDSWIKLFQINPNKIIRSGYVSDYDLVELYRKCELFVFPSFHEGFGLPVLEAMSCGAPVIASNCTSIPEIIELESAMFNPKNVDDIRNLIVKALTNKNFNNILRKNSLEQTEKFSWSISARLAIKACEDIITQKKSKSKDLDWDYLKKQRDEYLNLLLKKLKDLKKINKKSELAYMLCASIDKITHQVDYILRDLSNKEVDLSWRVEGPFDSSYSLSILNRSFAEALVSEIKEISIHVTEGFGDYSPNINYMKKYPQLFSLYQKSKQVPNKSNVMSRNLYPPRVSDMNAKFNILHSYGWEESSLPTEWVDNFNSSLQGITVMSEQVKKILIDNGVQIPIKVTGLGLDHLSNSKSTKDINIKAKKYKILHISSCFPRKGIDILLHAFANAFTCDDDVSLIIKTFDNPHNDIDTSIDKLRNSYSKFPDVIVIKDEYSDEEIYSLYNFSDLYVSPSRGEGFGLPIAEAMLLGVPVITTEWGGQLDFCNTNNSWLLDYKFVESDSHFNLDFSYWAEPSIKHLTKLLIEVYNLNLSQVEKKVNLAKESVSHLTWNSVVRKNIFFIKNDLLKFSNSRSKIGWISTWNQKCGIASYSRNFIDCIFEEVLVFAPFREPNNEINEMNVRTSWPYPSVQDTNLNQLYSDIVSSNISSLVIQFNYSFFDFREFSKFIDKITNKKINLIIFLHSTIDPDQNASKKLISLIDCLKKFKRVFVHTLNDLNRLKDIGVVENVSIFPHPIRNTILPKNQMELVPKINYKKKLIIGSYGFCLPNKGFVELIKSVPLLKKANIDFHINIFSSIYNKDYYYVYDELLNLIQSLGVEKEVTLEKDFLSSDHILSELSQQDLIVFPYQASNESSSASVRDALASFKPVLVTPLPIFDDVSGLVDYLPGKSPSELANGILSWYKIFKANPEDIFKLQFKRAKLINSRSFSRLSHRLSSIINSLEINNY